MATPQRSIERLRLLAISLGTDTGDGRSGGRARRHGHKLDLVVDQARFSSQAVSMWDPLGEGGRLQNQAYGYLFPMGPFFLIARWLDIPPWATQRLGNRRCWCAFLGMYCVARALGLSAVLAGCRCWARVRSRPGCSPRSRRTPRNSCRRWCCRGYSFPHPSGRKRRPPARRRTQGSCPSVCGWNQRRRHVGDPAHPPDLAA